MAYNEKLAARVREILSSPTRKVEEKKMFSGLCFMVNDKMCIGVQSDSIMVRVDPAVYDEVTMKKGCEPMKMAGKIMKGFVFVDENVLTTKKELLYWINLGLEFNPFAKSSKKPANKKSAKAVKKKG